MSEMGDRKRDEEAPGDRARSSGSPEALSSSTSGSASGASYGASPAVNEAPGEAPGTPGTDLAGAELRRPKDHGEEAIGEAGLDDVDLREIMRQVLDRPPRGAPPDILHGVQRKLRTRSRGKFYGDGWSTARAPRSTYLVTSLFMLALIAFVFLVLIPWGSGALPLP